MTSFKNSHTHVKHNTLVFFLGKIQAIKTVTAYFQYFNYFLLVVFSFSTEQRHNESPFNFFFLFCIGNWDIILLVRLYNLLDPLKDFGWMKN